MKLIIQHNEPKIYSTTYLTLGSSITFMDKTWIEVVRYVNDSRKLDNKNKKFKIVATEQGVRITRIK